MAERVDNALKTLLSEERPERLGIPKNQVEKVILHMNWEEAAE